MEEENKTKHSSRAKKATSLIMAPLIAASLPFGMLPLSAFAETADDAGYGLSITVDSESDDTVAPESAAGAPDSASASSETTPADKERADLVKAIGDAGADAYEKWLKGEELSRDELFAIDVDALRPIHPKEADAIAELQAAVKQQEESAADVPTEPAGEADLDSDSPQDDSSADETEASETKPSGKSEQAKSDETGKSKKSNASEPAKTVTVSDGQKPAEAGSTSDHPQWSYSGDTSYTPRNQNLNLTTLKFVALIGGSARKIAAENDLYASVMIAQAILESESGNSKLAGVPYFNLFGMKGDFKGSSVVMEAQEGEKADEGGSADVAYKSYPSYRESLADYAELMSGDGYEQARKSRTDSYADACDYLEGTYSTAKGYSKSLKDLITEYDLTRYDKSLDYKLAQTYTVQVESASTDSSGQKQEATVEERDLVDLVTEASSHLGCPYVWGADGPDTFDCSGMVQYSYAQALGVVLPRTSYWQCMEGEDVDFKDLHMGDLLFFTNSKGEVHHVAMYLAEGCYIESTSPGGVQVTALDERTPTFAKRMLKTVPVEAKELSPVQASSRSLRHMMLDGLNISYSLWDSDADRADERIRIVYEL